MPRTTNQISRTALAFGLAGALMTAGCHGAHTYSLGGAAFDAGGGGQEPGDGSGGSGGGSDGGGSGAGAGGGSGGASGALGELAETTGLDDAADPLGRVTVGDRTVLGQGAAGAEGPLGVSVLSPTTETGEVATVGVLSGGQVAGLSTGQPNSATAAATGAAGGLLGVTVGDQTVGADNPVVDLNVLAPTGAAGTVAGVDVLSNGQPVNATVNDPRAGQSPVSGAVDAVTGTVGGVVGGLPDVGAGAGAGAGTGSDGVGAGAVVGGVVGDVTGGLGAGLGLSQPK